MIVRKGRRARDPGTSSSVEEHHIPFSRTYTSILQQHADRSATEAQEGGKPPQNSLPFPPSLLNPLTPPPCRVTYTFQDPGFPRSRVKNTFQDPEFPRSRVKYTFQDPGFPRSHDKYKFQDPESPRSHNLEPQDPKVHITGSGIPKIP